MSTYLYLVCLTHDPHPRSDEVGHNLDRLRNIREEISNREELLKLVDLADRMDFELDHWDVPKKIMLNFFKEHRECELGIVDEYGKTHPLVEFTSEEQAARQIDVESLITFIEDSFGIELFGYQKEWLWRIYENERKTT